MGNCNDQSFYKYFNENMEAMGLPAPKSLFGSLGLAVGTASTILKPIDSFGKSMTVGAIIGATSSLEKLGVVAGISAAYYAGAVIGSIAVALGKHLSGGLTISDVIISAQRKNIYRPWLTAVLLKWPGIIHPERPGRILYQYTMTVAL
ncbi:MAG: hypothetical protein GY737_25660 [Desulfobacteraceae bacterium]|nr:hypothetical protein [Desulfobacteraceae bacterium]